MPILDFLNTYSGAFNVLCSVLLAVITGVYVYLTARLLRENVAMREQLYEPDIALSCTPHEAHIHLLFLNIENLGGGPAFKLSFSLNRQSPIPGEKRIEHLGLIRRGLSYLGPHQHLRTYWANATGDFESLKQNPLEITVIYSSSSGKQYERKYVIDYGQLEGLSSIGQPPLYDVAEHLKKIASGVDGVASGSRRLQVVHFTPADQEVEERCNDLFRHWRHLSEDERAAVTAHVAELATARSSPPVTSPTQSPTA